MDSNSNISGNINQLFAHFSLTNCFYFQIIQLIIILIHIVEFSFRIIETLFSWSSFLLQPFHALLGRLTFSILTQGVTASNSSMDYNHNQDYRYDVFISFRGADTRNTFVDHLYAHLTRKVFSPSKMTKGLRKDNPFHCNF